MKYLEIIMDMDEVVANLTKGVCDHYNKDFNDNKKWYENDNYWWKDFDKAEQSYFEELLNTKGLFKSLEPINGMVDILNELYEEGYSIYFCTAPQYNEYCFKEKKEWLEEHFEWFRSNMLIATEAKYLLANPNRALIDDNAKYLKEWQRKGGIAIGYGTYSWTKEHKGLKAENPRELKELINRIELKL